jgi:hypothetical protein
MGFNVRLIVPTHSEEELGPIIGRIIGRWGGVTVSKAVGWWADEDGVPVKDQVSVLECSIGGEWRQVRSVREWWFDLAETVRATFDQDSVFLSAHVETAMLVDKIIGVEIIGVEQIGA